MDRDTILRRAAKLAALAAEGGTMAEAESAGDALARLLAEHRMTMSEVNAASMRSKIRAEDKGTAWARIPRWAHFLAAGIADACGCTVLNGQRFNETRTAIVGFHRFIGEAGDAAVAAYWYEVLERTLPEIAERHRGEVERRHYQDAVMARHLGMHAQSLTRSWTKLRESFLMGAVVRLCERLKAHLAPPVGPEGDSGRALIVVKDQAIKDWIAQQHPDVRKGREGRIDPDASAVAAGKRAADSIPLADGIRHQRQATIPGLGLAGG